MKPLVNSLDAVSERDFALDLIYACTVLGVHLSRIGEEWVLWTSAEFGFARLEDAYSSGSSIMPQKKNPDAYELMRGKAGRLVSNLNALLITLKGLPLGYSKDLQEDKEPLFDSVDSVLAMLAVLPEMLRKVCGERQAASLWRRSSQTIWRRMGCPSGRHTGRSGSSSGVARRQGSRSKKCLKRS
jgi:argininosuccinate lyase